MAKISSGCWYLEYPQEPYAEKIRDLRSALLKLGRAGKHHLLLTGSWPGEGRTTVCLNLAAALAEFGQRVLIVDFSEGSPALNALATPGSPEGAHQPRPCCWPGVALLSLTPALVSSGGAYELLNQSARARLLTCWRGFDTVLVDAPALSVSRQVMALGGLLDGAVMLLSRERFKGLTEGNHSEDLRDFGIDVLGCVVNSAPAGPI